MEARSFLRGATEALKSQVPYMLPSVISSIRGKPPLIWALPAADFHKTQPWLGSITATINLCRVNCYSSDDAKQKEERDHFLMSLRSLGCRVDVRAHGHSTCCSGVAMWRITPQIFWPSTTHIYMIAFPVNKVTGTDCRHVKIHCLVQHRVIWVSKKRISKSSSFLN